ncbi:SDR family oxidoreductase [Peristeroidobacter agariperforans]|uniref:SDR family oxidoreductase n=1 Tax=Peristeroidobacter agariperforans TaxID=268404 RepID=UPI001300226E|nr:SDR family NAD(P)-dependent oxidoreductase [Peristeroidobacter agariperforans]
MRKVEDKVAFITGGSSGIGLGIARAFVDKKMKVVIGYRTKAHLEEAMRFFEKTRDRVHALSVDVTDRQSMEKAAAETVQVFGKVHVLVNNAGVVGFAPLSGTSYDDWLWMMNVNVHGVFNGVHSFLPRIQAHGDGGHIITTSSIAGLFAGSGAASYITSKFAVIGMMEALRWELDDSNIGVSVYCPGMVRSNIIHSNRNRPGNLGNTSFDQRPETIAAVEKHMKNPEIAMDPLKAGQLVLRGMRNNDLYILTHPEYRQIMKDRLEAIITSNPTNLHPNNMQKEVMRSMRQSIYRSELDRKTCTEERGETAK